MKDRNPILDLKEQEEITLSGEGGRNGRGPLYGRTRPTSPGGGFPGLRQIQPKTGVLMESMTRKIGKVRLSLPIEEYTEKLADLMCVSPEYLQGSDFATEIKPSSNREFTGLSLNAKLTFNRLQVGTTMLFAIQRTPEKPFTDSLASFNKKAKKLRKTL